jgi:hypothetical protein
MMSTSIDYKMGILYVTQEGFEQMDSPEHEETTQEC